MDNRKILCVGFLHLLLGACFTVGCGIWNEVLDVSLLCLYLQADISPFFDLREVSESLKSLFDRVLTASVSSRVLSLYQF